MTPDPDLTTPAPAWLLPAIIIGFPIFFFSLTWFVLNVLSLIGGWSRIAKRFPRQRPPEGRKYSMCSAQFGLVSYNNILTIHASAEGLDLSLPLYFKMGHKPIFIPWQEVRDPRPGYTLFLKRMKFQVGDPSAGKIGLPEKVFADMPVRPPSTEP